jgi:hypothetical protein
MTLFEYLAIAFSLLFSFTAMRLIHGLPSILDPERRYPVHVGFVLIQLFGTAAVFWAFWSYRDVTWTFARFVLALTSPGLIYLCACSLVPDDPGAVQSWRTYYYSARRKYFLAVSLWALVVATGTTVLIQMPLTHPARGVQAGLLAAGIVGTASNNARVHTGILAFLAALIATGAVAVLSRPGSLAQ